MQKRKAIRSKAIKDAANGEACTICGENNGTIVFCHLNESFAGKGMGQKADDIAGFFGCHICHMVYDGRGKKLLPHSNYVITGHSDGTIMRAMYRTWRRLIEKVIITIKDYEA